LISDSNSPRRVADYLKKLSQLGLLKRHDAYQGPGDSGFKYSLDKVDYNMIIQVLGESNPTGDTHDLLPDELVSTFEKKASGAGQGKQARVDAFD
jgi:hypothetical protein